MKKAFCILMCLIIFVAASMPVVSAYGETVALEYEVDGVHCIVEFENSSISVDKMQIIAEKLVGIRDDSVQTYGLGCTLFGHDLVTEGAFVTYHKQRASEPRCLRKTYEITYCEDCDDYYEEVLLFSYYIPCCPAD